MRLSVVVPTYNRADLLIPTLESVFQQERAADEVIVIDDGSTDATPDAVKRFGDSLTYIQVANGGQGAARLRGALEAQGDAICFLDSDDLLLPGALRDLENALASHADAAAAVGACELIDPDGAPAGSCQFNEAKLNGADVWKQMMHNNRIRTPGNVLIRRDRLLLAGNWDGDRRLRGNEDWDLWLRLLDAGGFVQIPEIVLKYRVHPQSTSANQARMVSATLFMLAKHLRKEKDNRERSTAISKSLQTMAMLALTSLGSTDPATRIWPDDICRMILLRIPRYTIGAIIIQTRVYLGAVRKKWLH